jgi:hypothetical protein
MWSNITSKYLKNRLVSSALAFQPFPNTIGKASEERGGNSMGLRSTDKPRFVVEIAGLYMLPGDEDVVNKMSTEFTDSLLKQLDVIKANANAVGAPIEEYLPYFMNDAGPDQDVTSSYREVQLFAKLKKEIDPNGFFSRTGGYKYKY